MPRASTSEMTIYRYRFITRMFLYEALFGVFNISSEMTVSRKGDSFFQKRSSKTFFYFFSIFVRTQGCSRMENLDLGNIYNVLLVSDC